MKTSITIFLHSKQVINMLYLLLLLLFLSTPSLQAQNTHKGQLRLIYLPIERIQMGGSISVDLPTHFHFIKPFDNTTRFAPDEPSSFSSLEYTFWVKEISQKIQLESALGLFRNHTKGDFLLDGEIIHFGLGNSQVGPSISIAMHYIISQWSLGTVLQSGIGPHFSRWTNDQTIFNPKDWGVKGFGSTNNLTLFLESPKWRERFSARALISYNASFSTYADFSSTSSSGTQTDYSDFSFSTRSKRPVFSISLGFDLQKSK